MRKCTTDSFAIDRRVRAGPDLDNDRSLSCGVVGGGVVEILKARTDYFSSLGIEFCIRKILVNNVNKKRDYKLPKGAVFTSSLDDVLSDPLVDLVVEVMGGITDARTVVFGALEAGKSVVTANKALISKFMPELEKTLKSEQ